MKHQDIPDWALNSAVDIKFAARHIREELAVWNHMRTGKIAFQDKGYYLNVWAWNKTTVINTRIEKQNVN